MEKFFKLKENNTSVSKEVIAGLTTFITMAYILIVTPQMLGSAGMDAGSVFTATAISAAISTACMALLSNYPFALASGMGLNAYFAYVVAAQYGWQVALVAVFIEGLIFIVISFVPIREAIFNSIPLNLKYAITAGIGLFIAFIGLQQSGLVVANESTLVSFGSITNITVVLTIIGIIICGALSAKKVKGSLLWGIIITYLLGVVCQMVGLYVPNPDAGIYSLYPTGLVSLPPAPTDNIITAVKSVNFSAVNFIDLLVVVFTFLFVDIFDTVGALIGVSSKAGYLDEKGNLPKAKYAFISDAVGTVVGAALGTSTVTTFVESASGVAEGGRTGLTGLVVAGMFLVALFFSPILTVIPAFATAPALIIVGLYMLDSVLKIDFSDITSSLPAFLTIIMIPLTYNISKGLSFGILSYILLKICTGKFKDINITLIIIGLFLFLGLVLS